MIILHLPRRPLKELTAHPLTSAARNRSSIVRKKYIYYGSEIELIAQDWKMQTMSFYQAKGLDILTLSIFCPS